MELIGKTLRITASEWRAKRDRGEAIIFERLHQDCDCIVITDEDGNEMMTVTAPSITEEEFRRMWPELDGA